MKEILDLPLLKENATIASDDVIEGVTEGLRRIRMRRKIKAAGNAVMASTRLNLSRTFRANSTISSADVVVVDVKKDDDTHDNPGEQRIGA